MAKNSNYQTAKRERERLEKEAALKQAKRNKILTWTLIPTAVAIIVALVVALLSSLGAFGYKVTHTAKIVIDGYGTVELELYGEEAPITVANFVKLANEDYYDGSYFYRIVQGFMAQGGAGGSSDGTAATIKGEFSANGVNNPIKHERGVISMARATSYNSASASFFIMQQANENLDGNYAAFGKVTRGMDIIDRLCAGRNTDLTGQYYSIRILEVFVYEA
ncbi:MAG: peptidylprolyl isomerase [Clostridia bacterium]|nr:peptidylprolyl isomerase [Clostridia bacterium]